jgi:hypothetical protein
MIEIITIGITTSQEIMRIDPLLIQEQVIIVLQMATIIDSHIIKTIGRLIIQITGRLTTQMADRLTTQIIGPITRIRITKTGRVKARGREADRMVKETVIGTFRLINLVLHPINKVLRPTNL